VTEPLHLLLLEHASTDVELCLMELERGGFDVRADVVGTQGDFEAQISANTYDIVLADYRLPDWTGMDALAVLQKHRGEIPLVLVTGTLGDELAVECLRQGVADYVVKQNLSRLPLVVRRVLDERRAREDSARAQDTIRKLTLAVDQSPASVIITDTAGKIEYVNQRFVDMTGYSAAESRGQSPRLLKSGRTPLDVYQDMWQTLCRGEVWHGELLNRTRNEALAWHSVTISPVRDSQGMVTHFLSTQEDITSRKRAERELREREERFRQIAENIKEVFFVMDAAYQQTLYISPAYEQIWGRTCRSLYENPRSFLEPLSADDRGRLIAMISQTQQGEQPADIEFRVVRPDGEVRWVLTNAAPIRNERGEVYRITGVAMDITERKRVEEALAESEALYRKVIEASFDGIAVSEAGVVLEANRGFAEIFGYAQDEVIGRSAQDLVAEESLEAALQHIADGHEGAYELVGKRKDGTKILLEAMARNHSIGGRRGRLTALRDVTEKRHLEEQFRQGQKMEAVGRLAGGVAHDFNNLLTVIISCTELLLMDSEEGNPLRDNMEEIRKAAQGAAELTRQLLAFSRQQVVEPKLVTIEEVVASAEKMLQRLIGEDVELVAVRNDDPATVKIDPSQLEQVIVNLAVNARDAMPDGGRLTLETSSVELDEAYARAHWPATPGRFALLAVSDTGIGMTEQTRGRIFEPFFTTKDVGKGTGLGLATVYGIVKQGGGFIWVYSEPGQGATFKIYLPRVDEAPTGSEQVTTATSLVGTETVLLIEDSPALRATARQILARYGYTVLEAPNGKAALALVGSLGGPIHLLLTDVVMPGMSGRELAERFTVSRPGVKVLYMSGYTDDAVVRHGVLRPGIAYLQKPFTPETLARKVREVLDGGTG
jgi:two-component system cell cycle sensor histidine kinase/response regulator CckA